jgi:Transposase and inactivated derivatives
LALTGPDRLLKALTKTVLETALNEELTEHLGYEKHDSAPKREPRMPLDGKYPAGRLAHRPYTAPR